MDYPHREHEGAHHASRAMDMTEGPAWKLLLAFAAPLLLGNLFQQLYNTVDSVVVGNFVGKEALAAVGSTTFLCNTFIAFFNGVAIGAGVVISSAFGARDQERLEKTVHTTALISVIFGLAATAIAVPLVPAMLRAIRTQADVMAPATLYLRIYFSGILFLFVYNMGSAVLRAVGDTRRPLCFLVLTSVLNIVLDLWFVVGLGWGIAGAAAATILSEAVSAVLVTLLLVASHDVYRIVPQKLRIDKASLAAIIRIGMPAGLQQAVTSFSNAFVQAYINGFSSSVVAAWSSCIRLDAISILPALSIGQGATTFVGQNLGAGKLARAKRGTRTAYLMGLAFILAVSFIMYAFAPVFVGLFTQDAEVLRYGTFFVRLFAAFRFLTMSNQVIAGALRGAGDSRGPMAIMILSFVVLRQLYLMAATRLAYTEAVVGFAYPLGWILCTLFSVLYYAFSGWEKSYARRLAVPAQPD